MEKLLQITDWCEITLNIIMVDPTSPRIVPLVDISPFPFHSPFFHLTGNAGGFDPHFIELLLVF